MVKINGEPKPYAGCSVTEVLEQEGFDITRVVVEMNLEILKKSYYETTILNENDSLEVVSFVGGG